jgi:DNA-binding transcriptional regulator YdaS (Cro superfamily)
MDLKTYIKKNRVRQKKLAEETGCRQAMISQIKSGKRRPSPELALRISRATGGQVSVMELLFGSKWSDRNAA